MKIVNLSALFQWLKGNDQPGRSAWIWGSGVDWTVGPLRSQKKLMHLDTNSEVNLDVGWLKQKCEIDIDPSETNVSCKNGGTWINK